MNYTNINEVNCIDRTLNLVLKLSVITDLPKSICESLTNTMTPPGGKYGSHIFAYFHYTLRRPYNIAKYKDNKAYIDCDGCATDIKLSNLLLLAMWE